MFTIGSRVTLKAPKGVVCEVDSIDSEPVRFLVLSRAAAITGTTAEAVAALGLLYESFESLGRPAWNLGNAKGPIPPTKGGMLTVPTDLMLALINAWTEVPDAG